MHQHGGGFHQPHQLTGQYAQLHPYHLQQHQVYAPHLYQQHQLPQQHQSLHTQSLHQQSGHPACARSGQLLLCPHQANGVQFASHPGQHQQHPHLQHLGSLTSVSGGLQFPTAHLHMPIFAPKMAIPPTIYHVTSKDPNLNSTMDEPHSPASNGDASHASALMFSTFSPGYPMSTTAAAAAASAASAVGSAGQSDGSTQSADLNSLSLFLPPMDNPSALITPVGASFSLDEMMADIPSSAQAGGSPGLQFAAAVAAAADCAHTAGRLHSPPSKPIVKWE